LIVVVEGPDKVGKSTIVDHLRRKLGLQVFKSSTSPLYGQTLAVSQAEDVITMRMLEALRPNMLFDRFFPSEYAYGLACERDIDVETLLRLDRQLARLEHVCLYVDHEPYAEDPDVPVDTWHAVRDAYESWMRVSVCNWHSVSDKAAALAVVKRGGDFEIDLTALFCGRIAVGHVTPHIGEMRVSFEDGLDGPLTMNVDKIYDANSRAKRSR
jgi:hypothetical protein